MTGSTESTPAEAPQDLPAVDVGQQEIEQDDVSPAGCENPERLCSVARADRPTLGLERADRRDVPGRVVVLDHQDRRSGRAAARHLVDH